MCLIHGGIVEWAVSDHLRVWRPAVMLFGVVAASKRRAVLPNVGKTIQPRTELASVHLPEMPADALRSSMLEAQYGEQAIPGRMTRPAPELVGAKA
jgi:hypothetical protein